MKNSQFTNIGIKTMTRNEIRAQFIIAQAELLKLHNMINMSDAYEDTDILTDLEGWVASAHDNMTEAANELRVVIAGYDNEFNQK
jgi:hypothetical protein